MHWGGKNRENTELDQMHVKHCMACHGFRTRSCNERRFYNFWMMAYIMEPETEKGFTFENFQCCVY